jgi:hypothetical protein
VGRPGCGSELNIFSSNSQLQKHAEHILIKKKCFTKMKNKTKTRYSHKGRSNKTTTAKNNNSDPQKHQPSNATLHATENK